MDKLSKLALIAATGIASASIAGFAQQQQPFDPYSYVYRPHMMDWRGYGVIFGPLFMFLVLGVLVAFIVLLVRWLAVPRQAIRPPYDPPPGSTPLDILRERYARGEIDKEEFEERCRILGD